MANITVNFDIYKAKGMGAECLIDRRRGRHTYCQTRDKILYATVHCSVLHSLLLVFTRRGKLKQNCRKRTRPSDVYMPWDICQKIPLRWRIQIVKKNIKSLESLCCFLIIYLNSKHSLMTPYCERWHLYSQTSSHLLTSPPPHLPISQL